MSITLVNDDCLEAIQSLDDESVDLTLTSPPYCIGKAYDVHITIEGFIASNREIIEKVYSKTKPGGSICWQVGHHVRSGEIIPLDFIVYDLFREFCPEAKLRNRIIWSFGHGANCVNRFSGRHETILWFSKGNDYYFDLDTVRVPQKYPGKKHYKGSRKGEYSCNPLGKNPGDVWEIPNVKAGHVEKTDHPCQFPVGLAQRVVRSMSPKEGLVLDPFMGSGSTGVACILEKRKFVGFELDRNYFEIAKNRLDEAGNGKLRYRDVELPILDPKTAGAVGRSPFELL